MDFFLFILVNAALFIRPSELIPATYGWPIYEIVIVMNLLVAGPAIVNQFSERSLMRTPITVCVFGVVLFVILSQLVRFEFERAFNSGWEFAKIVVYYMLLVVTVNTPRRLFTLLAAVVVFTLAVGVISVLQYHGVIELPTLRFAVSGDGAEVVARLSGTGIFGDPNDFSMITVVCLLICAAGLFYRRLGVVRFTVLPPAAFLFYCLTLTHSRGGLLAFIMGCGVLAYGWLGAFRAALGAAAGFPVLFMGIGSRQADFSGALTSGTGRSRVELWSMGLEMLKGSPLFGVGYEKYAEFAGGHVAHNSFVQAFGELGFFGGTMFLGIFAVAGWSLWSLRSVRYEIVHPGMCHMLPFLLAIVAGYCVSMMALSQNNSLATYFIAGLAVCYDRLVRPDTSLPPLVLNGRLVQWLLAVSVGFLACLYLYIKVFFR